MAPAKFLQSPSFKIPKLPEKGRLRTSQQTPKKSKNPPGRGPPFPGRPPTLPRCPPTGFFTGTVFFSQHFFPYFWTNVGTGKRSTLHGYDGTNTVTAQIPPSVVVPSLIWLKLFMQHQQRKVTVPLVNSYEQNYAFLPLPVLKLRPLFGVAWIYSYKSTKFHEGAIIYCNLPSFFFPVNRKHICTIYR